MVQGKRREEPGDGTPGECAPASGAPGECAPGECVPEARCREIQLAIN